MKPAEEIHVVAKNFAVWQAFDPQSKVDCTSSAVLLPDVGWAVVDPLALAPAALAELTAAAPITAVFCTSCNHERFCREFSLQSEVPLFAPEEALIEFRWENGLALCDGTPPVPGVLPITLEGGAIGETACWFEDAAVIVVGDAIINLESTGLALLPAKYCSSQKSLAVSLEKLLRYPFKTLSFAHGPPLVANPKERLADLLNE